MNGSFITPLAKYWGYMNLDMRAPKDDNYSLPELPKNDFVKLLDERDLEVDIKGLKKLIESLHKSAEFTEIFCDLSARDEGETLENCQPNNMIAVYPLGVPDAHESLFLIYYVGPVEIRNSELAYFHRYVAAITGKMGPYSMNPYSCEHSIIFKKYPELYNQMIHVLKIDIRLSREEKVRKIEELDKCHT